MLSLKPGLILALGALLVASIGGATVAADAKKSPVAVVETSLGTVEIELDSEHAPVTVKNFVSYAKKGFYNGTIFHRVISTFMIQGGGFTSEFEQKKTEAPITNEAGNGLKNVRGTIAMARTSDPNSATAQFFINVKDNDFLNHQNESAQGFGYAVFGKVTKGMDVVDKIKEVKTGMKETPRGALGDAPVDTVLIKSVTIKE